MIPCAARGSFPHTRACFGAEEGELPREGTLIVIFLSSGRGIGRLGRMNFRRTIS